ncbi:MAG: helix-turn-helix domain-containing protein [Thermoplasmata archaeon]|nr:helix-turn-helix domain-containing protein [Thermoplasmata archaeon]
MELPERIAGEIVMADDPGKALRKWRQIFGISQKELTGYLHQSPSVLSDYESGRRVSPGVRMVRKIVTAMIEIDQARGGGTLQRYDEGSFSEAIPDRREFAEGMDAKQFVKAIGGQVVGGRSRMRRILWGYTVIDSLKAITTLSSTDYLKVYGYSSERALVFLGVMYGRSPMVAIRSHPLKPGLVVFHQPGAVDPLAIELAEVEHIPLATTDIPLDELMERLHSLA